MKKNINIEISISISENGDCSIIADNAKSPNLGVSPENDIEILNNDIDIDKILGSKRLMLDELTDNSDLENITDFDI